MKLVHISCILVSLALGLLIFMQVPITKLTTTKALTLIESRYLRLEMTDEEKTEYQQIKGGILANQSVASSRLTAARYLGMGACLVLFLQSLAVLQSRRKIAEPRTPPNGSSASLPGNSQIREGPTSVS